jgi:ABC-type lipoprotein release transport system permease subunit
MKSKKGALSVEMMIVAVLGLIVLIVIASVFSGQVSNFVKSIFGISSEAQDISKSCKYQGNYCTSEESCSQRNGFVVPPPSEGWNDCKQVCCQV